MTQVIINLNNQTIGSVELKSSIFALPERKDIIARMVNYQLAKRRAGTHKARGISDISGTTRKPFKQKGTGNARQGSLRSPHMRGGACIFGPVVRSHAFKLTKKFRNLALRTALSIKLRDNNLIIINNLDFEQPKTKKLLDCLSVLGINSALFIDGPVLNENFVRAASNLYNIDVLPLQGLNVYDILRRETLVMTKTALEHLEEKLL